MSNIMPLNFVFLLVRMIGYMSSTLGTRAAHAYGSCHWSLLQNSYGVGWKHKISRVNYVVGKNPL